MAALMIDNVAPLIIMMQRNERYLDGCMYQLTEVFELGANFTLTCQFQREQNAHTVRHIYGVLVLPAQTHSRKYKL